MFYRGLPAQMSLWKGQQSRPLTFLDLGVPEAPPDAVDRADSDPGAIGVAVVENVGRREKLVQQQAERGLAEEMQVIGILVFFLAAGHFDQDRSVRAEDLGYFSKDLFRVAHMFEGVERNHQVAMTLR